jgi:pyridoxine kinase
MVCSAPSGRWLVSTPLLPMTVRGGGDVTAAVFLAHTLTDGPRTALSRTAATMFAVLSATHEDGVEEMALVAEQDAIAQPDERFEVVEIT